MKILFGILNSMVILSSIFMICLILIQRGKGGGLAGAFGGMGGSSAFGTKAGDVFTRVTMVTAVIWMLMLMILVVLYNRGGDSAWTETAPTNVSKEVPPTPGGGSGKSRSSGATTPDKASAPTSSPTPAPARPSSSSGSTNVPVFPEEKSAPATPAPTSK
jgi:preprotein translocase subunit SecG